MGRDRRRPRRPRLAGCFNSRARMGRDKSGQHPAITSNVSIRAPAWGAMRLAAGCYPSICFNSRARMGRDAMICIAARMIGCFNSRARMGRDLSDYSRDQRGRVSIRAPAWGAMPTLRRSRRRGAFQFARPHGARFRPGWFAGLLDGFNSRARMGRDPSALASAAIASFQFARPHGARWGSAGAARAYRVSIRAPAWGAIHCTEILSRARRFQFARPHGARCGQAGKRNQAKQFQFARPHGARSDWPDHKPPQSGVSIRAPAWGAIASLR